MPARFRFLTIVDEIIAVTSAAVGRPPDVVGVMVTGTSNTSDGDTPSAFIGVIAGSMAANSGRDVAGEGGGAEIGGGGDAEGGREEAEMSFARKGGGQCRALSNRPRARTCRVSRAELGRN